MSMLNLVKFAPSIVSYMHTTTRESLQAYLRLGNTNEASRFHIRYVACGEPRTNLPPPRLVLA